MEISENKLESFDRLSDSISVKSKNTVSKKFYFTHLNFANQTYFQHMKDSMSYFLISLKASFFFFVHAIWPDCFEQSGSMIIHSLSKTINDKYEKRIKEINDNKI